MNQSRNYITAFDNIKYTTTTDHKLPYILQKSHNKFLFISLFIQIHNEFVNQQSSIITYRDPNSTYTVNVVKVMKTNSQ